MSSSRPPAARLVRRLLAGLLAIGLVGVVWAVLPALRPPPPIRDLPLPAFDAPGDLRRIAVLGTSLSANRYAWPEQLRDRLQSCLGHPVELVRIARPGAHSGWGRDQTEQLIAARPDLVLIEFSINDADLKDGLGVSQSAQNHRDILAGLTTARPDARVLLMTMSPVRGLQMLFRPRLSAYYALYPQRGAAGGHGVLDLYPRWRAGGATSANLPDGLHPTDAAATDLILPPLLDHIGRAAGQACAA